MTLLYNLINIFFLQVAKFLHEASDGVTLAFDATTQSGVHVNAINIHNKQVEYVVALDELPGETLF